MHDKLLFFYQKGNKSLKELDVERILLCMLSVHGCGIIKSIRDVSEDVRVLVHGHGRIIVGMHVSLK